MAESVDALVSNTSGVTSIPVRPRVWVQIKLNDLNNRLAFSFMHNPGIFCKCPHKIQWRMKGYSVNSIKLAN